jgi:hypothetical protein
MVLVLLLVNLAASAWANPPSEAPPTRIVDKPVELLKCKPASNREEKAAQTAAEIENFSDHESFARLILSETLSTGYVTGQCEAPGIDGLMEAIAWGVINRVQKYSPKKDDPKPDAYSHVIYQPKQFSSSFSGKNNNPFAVIFLCPMKARAYLEKAGSKEDAFSFYNRAKKVASEVMDKYQRSGIPAANSKLSLFFYPHSEFSPGRPAWAKDPDPAKNKGYVNLFGGPKPCVEFYQR